MEKRWLGSVGLVLVLVLLVFAVGYSAGNSPTGYGFFDAFKKVSKTVSPVPESAIEERSSSSSLCNCDIRYLRLNRGGERSIVRLSINGNPYEFGVGDSLIDASCAVELFDIDSQRGNAISLEVNNQRVSLWPGRSRSVNTCLDEYESSCGCDIRLVRFNRDGNPVLRINGENYEIGNGDSVGGGNCLVNVLSSDVERRAVNLLVNGQSVNLMTDYYG